MSSKICRFFTSPAGCRNGSNCPFSHNNIQSDNKNETRAAPPCRFLRKPGGCRNGLACPFSHIDDGVDKGKVNLKVPGFVDFSAPPLPPQEEPVLTRHLAAPFFAIDVECVATGYSHMDRAVARIAIVDEDEKVFYDSLVKPEEEVVSCLTALTGIEIDQLATAPGLSEVLLKIREILPKDSVIVGQSIQKDLEWIKLEKTADYMDSFDIAELFKLPKKPNASGKVGFRYFSLRHVAKHLMGDDIQEDDHDPVVDAVYAMKIFKKYRYLHESPGHLQAVRSSLARTPITRSFSKRMPFIDKVALSAEASKMRPKEEAEELGLLSK